VGSQCWLSLMCKQPFFPTSFLQMNSRLNIQSIMAWFLRCRLWIYSASAVVSCFTWHVCQSFFYCYNCIIYKEQRSRTGRVAQVVDCLPSKREALSSNSNTAWMNEWINK
jgi:hypothetical protein